MNDPVRILLGLCGVSLVLGIWLGGHSIIEAQNAAALSSAGRHQQLPPMSIVQKKPGRVEHRKVRRILRGKEGGAVTSSNLERLPPRAPLERQSLQPNPERSAGDDASRPDAVSGDPKERKPMILYRPVAKAAGVLDADGYRITLADIVPVGEDETCPLSTGGTWPCGVMARTAFRAWLRGRAITCNVPAAKGPVTSSCTVGGDDPALWLAGNGWVESGGARYRDAVDKAKKQRKGIFGDPPKAFSSMPAFMSPTTPPSPGENGEVP